MQIPTCVEKLYIKLEKPIVFTDERVYNERKKRICYKEEETLNKTITAAVLGCGSRGSLYASLLLRQPEDRFKITALCDTVPDRIKPTLMLPNIGNPEVFCEPDVFFEKRRADFLVIASPDRFHVPQAIKALRLGYDILLEKPISDSREELDSLLEQQKRTGKKVIVCHELRYGVVYRKCAELLRSGVIGKLNLIDASERPVYWHWAQAYVRGIGASIKDGHPAILAKCSHDLDLIRYYADSECDTVSSIGDLRFFVPENAPEGSAERCINCKYKDTCIYSAKRIYIDKWHEEGEPEFLWPYTKVSFVKPVTEESLYKGLAENEYGLCAFKCRVDKVDHQIVQMSFKNGVKASLKMIYGAEPGRRITFYGSMGEITMEERTNEIRVMPFGGEEYVIDIGSLAEDVQGHGGGDNVLAGELYGILNDKTTAETTLSEAIECHLMGIAAEESRKQGGVLVKVHKT